MSPATLGVDAIRRKVLLLPRPAWAAFVAVDPTGEVLAFEVQPRFAEMGSGWVGFPGRLRSIGYGAFNLAGLMFEDRQPLTEEEARALCFPVSPSTPKDQ